MFAQIYPAQHRDATVAAIHMAEELGEYTDAIMAYRTRHRDEDLKGIALEAADFLSCVLGVYNSLGEDASTRLNSMFTNGCHECQLAPCQCSFEFVMTYRA
jgi:NTP pyrophosphatase (non-canonical NTP hydrolase)